MTCSIPRQKALAGSQISGQAGSSSLWRDGAQIILRGWLVGKLPREGNNPIISRGGGGERGIRTLDRVSPIHAFQACAFNHSATSPCAPDAEGG